MQHNRLFALALALLLALSLTAAAQPAQPLENTYTVFAHPRFGYEVEYPKDWTLLEKDTIQQVIQGIKEGQAGLSDAAVQMATEAFEQIQATDLAVFVASQGKGSNFNVVALPMNPTPPIDVVLQELPPVLHEQFQRMYPNIQWEDKGSLARIGGLDGLRIAYRFNTPDHVFTQVQYYVFVGGQQHILTFTRVSPDEAELAQLLAHEEHILSTFSTRK